MAETEEEILAAIEEIEQKGLSSTVDTIQYSDRMQRNKTNSAHLESIDYYRRKLESLRGGRSRQIRVRSVNGF